MLPPSAARSRSADPAAEPELVGPPASDLVDVECANRNCALLVTLCSVQLHRKKARRKKLEATEKLQKSIVHIVCLAEFVQCPEASSGWAL